MKKFLLGVTSLGLASLALAGNIDPSADPVAGTNVFTKEQGGAIAINGRLVEPMRPLPVKYVVYATSDDGATKSDVLELKDFAMSPVESECGFKGDNPIVCVRKVEGKEIVDLTDEKVIFRVTNKTISAETSREIEEGHSTRYDGYQLLGKDKIERALWQMNYNRGTGENYGYLMNYSTGIIYYRDTADQVREYHDGKSIEFKNEGKGNIKIVSGRGQHTDVPMEPDEQRVVVGCIIGEAPDLDGCSEISIIIR